MFAVAAIAVAASLGSCGGGEEEAAEAGVVTIQGAEYAYVMPDEVPSGLVAFEFENVGPDSLAPRAAAS